MEGETLLPLKWPNCFQMTESRELFDSFGGLVTTNALAFTHPMATRSFSLFVRCVGYGPEMGSGKQSKALEAPDG